MLSRLPYKIFTIPTANVNEVPKKIMQQVSWYINSGAMYNHFPVVSFFKDETDFYIQAEPITKVHSILATRNFYVVSPPLPQKSQTIVVVQSFFKYHNQEKMLELLNILETVETENNQVKFMQNPLLQRHNNNYFSRRVVQSF